MSFSNPYSIRFLSSNESGELCEFLADPTIDRSFRPPLSQREVSIEERVASKFGRGFWLAAFNGNKIIGCRGCNGLANDSIIEFSTTVVAEAHRRTGVGRALLAAGVVAALSQYGRHTMCLDSTPENIAVAAAVGQLGFVAGTPYTDEAKRGPGGLSVEYTLTPDTILPIDFDPQGLSPTAICRQITNPQYTRIRDFISDTSMIDPQI